MHLDHTHNHPVENPSPLSGQTATQSGITLKSPLDQMMEAVEEPMWRPDELEPEQTSHTRGHLTTAENKGLYSRERTLGKVSTWDEEASYQPCYSVRVVRPFVRLLRRYEAFFPDVLDEIEKLDLDERIAVTSVHELLRAARGFTGDPYLGLKAARGVLPGDLGVLDYVINTAATVNDAIEEARSHRRLINDTLYFQVDRQLAAIRMENSVVVPQYAIDFQLAVFYRNHLCFWPRSASEGYEVWFTCGSPDFLDEYEATFPASRIRFSAPFNGFILLAKDLKKPLPTADPSLHHVVKKHADLILSGLPTTQSVTEKVRELVLSDLSAGGRYARRVSQQMDISIRTLIRRLKGEGTTFKHLLDDIRRRLAINYVGRSNLKLADVASLLGFSQPAAFHRAFKRWTGQSPLQYRRSRAR